MSVDAQCYVVWKPSTFESGWLLPPVQDGLCTSGGHRQLHELAVAIAANGRKVEVRGEFDLAELKALADAAGAAPELPAEPRRPGIGDVILMPEGFDDPLTFGYVALSGARRILLLLAPSGLFGWSFMAGWSLEEPVDIEVAAVGRAEHFRAMDAMGFELWTNIPVLRDRIEAAGVKATFFGAGRSVPFPDPLPKRYDVATLANNRWSELARSVVAQLDPAVVHHEIPPVSNDEVLRQFGQARIFIHPLRVEGDSRLGQEARAMGAIPVVLSSSPYSVGLDDEGGAVTVSGLEDMPNAVMELLGDAKRLDELRTRGMESARAYLAWDPFVERVGAALSNPPPGDPDRDARAVIGDRLIAKENDAAAREEFLSAQMSSVRAELTHARAELAERNAALVELSSAIERIHNTRAWRLAVMYWRARARLKSAPVALRQRLGR
jgi:hypothetical protein